MLEKDLDRIQGDLLAAIADAKDVAALEAVRVRALGKKGEVTGLMKTLGALGPDERKTAGQALNTVKDTLAAAIEARQTNLADAELESRLAGERIDVSLPARPDEIGRIHPISQTIEEMVAIFGEMGFSVAEGPDICPPMRMATGRSCAPTPRRCRSAPCNRSSRRSASSCRGAPTAPIPMPPIRPCSIRWKG